MKTFCYLLLVGAASLACARAQISVELKAAQDQFLPGEPINVAARIVNQSGQTLALGADNDWLAFSVESREGFLVNELAKTSVTGEFTLESSKAATKRLDLQPSFDFGRPGRYLITADVKIKDWNQVFSSKACQVDIIQGAKLWQQEFGVPVKAGQPADSPEVRKYSLQQANYLKRLKLYVQITDAAESRIIKVFSIGPMVSFSHPEAQLDKHSNLHILWQTGASRFSYHEISPDGVVLKRQTHEYLVNSRPRLALDDKGVIVVRGGGRRVTPDDIGPKEVPEVPKPASVSQP